MNARGWLRHRTSVRVTVLLAVAAALLAVVAAPAGSSTRATCTDNWTNASGGDWSDAGNWSSGVPTASQVCITLAGTYTVEITAADGAEAVTGFTIGGASGTQTLQIDAGAQLTASGTSNNQANGAIVDDGTFTVASNGVFNEGAGTVSGNPVTINNGFLNFTGGGGASSFVISSIGSTVVTGSTSASESVELVSAAVNWAGPFTNAGTISITGSGSFLGIPAGTLTNTGTIRTEAGAGISTLSGNISSSGSIVVDGALSLSTTLTNTGSLSVGSGIPLGYGGTITNAAGGVITNSGVISSASNAVFNEGAGTV